MMPWLTIPTPAPRPSRVEILLANLLRRTAAPDGPADATSREYFEWQKANAVGLWSFYWRRLPGPAADCRVLDVGSGAGGHAATHAAQTAARFHCVEIDGDKVRAARRYAGSRLCYTQADATRLPFGDGTFDVCVSESTLEHVSDPAQVVAEMVRVTKPDGYLFVSFPPWRGAYAGHVQAYTRLPWIHLLPARLFARLMTAIIGRERADSTLALIAGHLNGWSTGRLLRTFDGRGLRVVDAYALGQWAVSRWLRFVPTLGELFALSIHLVLQKRPGRVVTTYNGVLGHMVRDRLAARPR